ncbi:MAG: hypothetical protein FWE05_12070 [Defluviitaleaceae bacterium]|nr:hypothetical protein [Defluviitaleaceae bacterium]
MLKMETKEFNQIRQWMYRNARNIELALWQYEFENGSEETVLDALSFYQNEDGGFGNALEPDSLNPNSTPYTTNHAINILNSIGFKDAKHPMIRGILRFLDSGAYFSENGWQFTIPTNNEYPHAIWWTYIPNDATDEFGLTAELVSFILCVAEKDSPLYKKAITLVEKLIEIPRKSTEHDDSGGNVQGICKLAETLQNLDLLDKLNAEFLPEAAQKMLSHSIVTDSAKWLEYGGNPHYYIRTPDSIYYKDYQGAVQQELDYLIQTRPKHDVWGITWTWFENTEKYAKAFAISENCWKGFHCIWKMCFLKNFDRLILEGSHD